MPRQGADRSREHTTAQREMAMDDGCNCKQAARPTPPHPWMTKKKKKKSSRLGVVVLPLVAFLALAAAHLARAAREPRDLAFVAAAHGALALLFLCLGRHEAAAPTAEAATGPIKVGVWALSTALTGMFACRVAPAMPPPLALLVYGMAALVTAGGFVLLFLCNDGGRR